jgi:prefoldin beta subunit
MSSNLSPEIQEKIAKYQQFQNQLRSIRIQMDSTQRQTLEFKQTIKDLETLDESAEIYKMSGSVLFKSSVNKVKAELQEKIEFSELQLQSLKKKEEKSEKTVQDIERDLSAVLPPNK